MNGILMERIKELMSEKNITQSELAKALGITQATLSRNLNGVHRVKAEVIEGIASYFNVSSDYLLGNTDIRTNKNHNVDPTDIEFALHNSFQSLTEEDKKKILEYAELLAKKAK